LSGNHAVVDCVQRLAVADLVLSQEDKPKRYRSAGDEISHETAILSSSVCAQDNSPWSPARMLQTTSCSAVVSLLFYFKPWVE